MKSALGKRHKAVIDSAPDAMRPRMVEIAISALMRAYEAEGTPEREALNCYLDAESLWQPAMKAGA